MLTELRAADFVLPGASYVEKEASYTNGQAGSRDGSRHPPPGEAMEDWEILVNLGVALGVPFAHPTADQVRADIASRFSGGKRSTVSRSWDLRSRPPRDTGCRTQTRRSDGSGISCFRTCRQ